MIVGRLILQLVACVGLPVIGISGPVEDLAAFREGERLVFDTTGHPKAKGVRMRFFYPHTWKAVDGSRPNIVQKFVSDAGKGQHWALIQTRALPPELGGDLSEDAKRQVLTEDVLKEFVPPGGKFLSSAVTKIDGELCGMIEYETTSERVGLTLGQVGLMFVIPRPGTLLILSFSTGGDGTSGLESIRRSYRIAKPLLLHMAALCVLSEKWKTP